MLRDYQLSCESTVDLPYTYLTERGVHVLFYTYTIEGKTYFDDMGRDPKALPQFYRFIAEKKLPSTSQINTYTYIEYFDRLLQEGDVLHIAFGSGLTPSVRNAEEAANKLRAKYPERRIIVIDSTCASSGYGLLIDSAIELWKNGSTMDELQQWLLDTRETVHHHFFSTDMQYFRRSGRVSGATATVASLLGICPLMRLNRPGSMIAYSKVRGKRNAIAAIIRVMEQHAVNGTAYSGKCFLSHTNCLEDAKETARLIESRFPHLNGGVQIFDIGTIVASHCGPGTISLFFYGDQREE